MQATMEWEAQDEGYLARILVGDGTQDIEVGTPVAVMVDDADSVSMHPCVHLCLAVPLQARVQLHGCCIAQGQYSHSKLKHATQLCCWY